MVIIGEKINASIPAIRKAIVNRDGETLRTVARDQVKAGAGFIDINVGTGEGSAHDEIQSMQWIIGLLHDEIEGLFCIDSADIEVLEAGLRHGTGKVGLINSVKATDASIAEILKLSAEFKVSVVGLAMDETGIPKDVRGRLRACEKIARGAENFNIPLDHIYFDPLALPVSTDASQGMVTLETLSEIKKQFAGAKTVLAVSNISFGLPSRSRVNTALLQMAMFLSVDAVLVNPLDTSITAAIRAADVILGRDRHCRRYTRAYRQGLFQ